MFKPAIYYILAILSCLGVWACFGFLMYLAEKGGIVLFFLLVGCFGGGFLMVYIRVEYADRFEDEKQKLKEECMINFINKCIKENINP